MAEIQSLLGTVTYNVGNYLNLNTHSSSVRRTVYPIQWHTVVTGLCGCTRIETNIYCNRRATWTVNETLSVTVEVMAMLICKHLFI